MRTRTKVSYIIGIILILVVGSIPVDQMIEKDLKVQYLSDQENRIEVSFGGPRITWVTVECNITAEIHYLYPNGTWVGIQNILLESTTAMRSRFNYYGEHPTVIVEVIGETPFLARITYTYITTMKMSYLERVLYTFGLYG